jgi:nucleotidyltransferase/DNA polymerase involved in DNA repair
MKGRIMQDTRQLSDLVSIGPAMLRDFERLGIRTVRELARRNPERLYEQLCEVTGQRHDICCLDVFHAAVAQARNPRLPAAHKQWWYYSRLRKKKQNRK